MESVENKRSWEETLYCLGNTHTLSIKDICGMLKVSRQWVSKYILPFVDTIYLPNGTVKGVNWVKIASLRLDKKMSSCVWCNKKEVEALIMNGIVSITRQTRCLPIEWLIDSNHARKFAEEYRNIQNQLEEQFANFRGTPSDIFKIAELNKEKDKIICSHASGAGRKLFEGRVKKTQRGKVARVECELPNVDIKESWIAPHDMLEYGDSDELLYRSFFENGFVRIELVLPDSDGCLGKKVYYIETEKANSLYGECVTVSEAVWQKYKHEVRK